MRKGISSVLFIVLIVIEVLAVGDVTTQSSRVPVIVVFRDEPDVNLTQLYGGKIRHRHSIIPAIACQLPQWAIKALERDPKVAYVEEDGVVRALGEALPWSVDRINAEAVHPYNQGTGVQIAVIDTGIDYNHPDLDDNVAGGKSFVDYTTDYMDDHGHGTHVAGIIAAENNEMGVLGVAPESSLYALKTLDSQGSGYLSDIVAAIEWSVDNGMQIISMSLGTNYDFESLRTACDKAYEAGLILVAAAGNDATEFSVLFDLGTVDYPARYDSVIAVGATNIEDVRANWSSTGPELELAAPGVNIYSTYLGDEYVSFSGTSMACPQVAGTAALVIKTPVDPAYDSDEDGVWDAAEVRSKLQDTAEDLGDPGRDPLYGYGLVDAALGKDVTPPSISAVAASEITDSSATVSWITDQPSDSAVHYGTTKALGSTVRDATMVTSHSITLSGLAEETTYYYEVESTDSSGNTAVDDNSGRYYELPDRTPPSTITDLTATAGVYPNIQLKWTATTDNVGVDHYNIYRSTSATIDRATDRLTITIGTATSYLDSTGITETTYYYAVCGVDAAGNEADLSNTASATVARNAMHVKSIEMSTATLQVWRWSWTKASAVVTIVDANDNVVEGATVTGYGSGLTSGNVSGVTDANGQVTFNSRSVMYASGTFTFTVDNVEKEGWIYDSTANEETSQSITI